MQGSRLMTALFVSALLAAPVGALADDDDRWERDDPWERNGRWERDDRWQRRLDAPATVQHYRVYRDDRRWQAQHWRNDWRNDWRYDRRRDWHRDRWRHARAWTDPWFHAPPHLRRAPRIGWW